MTKKEIGESFLKLASSGRVREAYEKHVHPQFRHHNPYFRGDRQSLLAGMDENARQFPEKTYQTLHAIEEGMLVAIHGRVALAPDSHWSVIHIFRFEDDLIIEEWEASQGVPVESPNENGIF
ncbi:MAG: nuclear transport factor 2 family protein [Acidobacteria bacterium]|nr:MAG: nuclear transport factor 2 family protein [Acidobacteriota bacterium]